MALKLENPEDTGLQLHLEIYLNSRQRRTAMHSGIRRVPAATPSEIHRLDGRKNIDKLLGLRFESIVNLGIVIFHDLRHSTAQRSRRKALQSFRISAHALNHRPGITRDAQHGRVLTQSLNEQQRYAIIARIHRRTLEQQGAKSTAAGRFGH